MDFEHYTKRINSVKDIKSVGHLSKEKQKPNRFTTKKQHFLRRNWKIKICWN